jgi:protein involved in polysaccharide export with SLBB domain
MPKFLFVLLLLLTICPLGGLRAQEAVSDPGLQPGDVVEITVWQREELSGEFTVSQDGTLVHPLYQQVRVTGLPSSQIQDRVRSYLSQFESNPQVIVRPLYKVAVAGAVMRPDIYSIQPGTTLSQVVTQAGGVTETADTDEVQLTRGTRVIEFNLRDLAAIQTPVQSGDQILVKAEAEGGGFRNRVLPILTVGLHLATIAVAASR